MIDEVGYLSLESAQASLLFQVIAGVRATNTIFHPDAASATLTA